MIIEFGVVCDYSRSGIVGAHHAADVNRLDVGEISKDPCAGCAGRLKVTHLTYTKKDSALRVEMCPPLMCVNLKATAAGVCGVDGEGEPEHRRGDRLVQGPPAVRVLEHVVEDELGLVVAAVHDRTHLDGQADGGGAAVH